jgi:hypothetical protein
MFQLELELEPIQIQMAQKPMLRTEVYARALRASLISPTHKRTEGRAPMWGSELTSKDAALQGGVGEIAASR